MEGEEEQMEGEEEGGGKEVIRKTGQTEEQLTSGEVCGCLVSDSE